MPDSIQVQMAEGRFVSRFRENWETSMEVGVCRECDRRTELRKLTSGKLLFADLESKYPLGRSISVQSGSTGRAFGRTTESVVLTASVVIRLARFVETGGDEVPFTLAELHGILSEMADSATRNRSRAVLGLFSPTGWAAEAQRFVANDPPGSGWASGVVRPILIGPEITTLVWDTKDSKLQPYLQYFCGLTVEERRTVCTDDIQKAVVVQDFANLEKIARTRGFDIEFVKSVAKEFCRDTKELKLAVVRGVGPVVKRRG